MGMGVILPVKHWHRNDRPQTFMYLVENRFLWNDDLGESLGGLLCLPSYVTILSARVPPNEGTHCSNLRSYRADWWNIKCFSWKMYICTQYGYSLNDYDKRWGRPTKAILFKSDDINSWLEYMHTMGITKYKTIKYAMHWKRQWRTAQTRNITDQSENIKDRVRQREHFERIRLQRKWTLLIRTWLSCSALKQIWIIRFAFSVDSREEYYCLGFDIKEWETHNMLEWHWNRCVCYEWQNEA